MSQAEDPSGAPARQRAVLRAVERAAGDLRRGGFLLLHDDAGQAALLRAAEGLDADGRAALTALGDGAPALVLTRQRARHLGLIGRRQAGDGSATDGPAGDGSTGNRSTAMPAPVLAYSVAGRDPAEIAELADPASRRPEVPRWPALDPVPLDGAASALAAGAVSLAKIARLLPAVLFVRCGRLEDPEARAGAQDMLALTLAAVEAYRFAAAGSLRRVAEARVPLAGAEDTRIVAFRPSDGGVEHLAIVIGRPEPGKAVLTRLHSECFTGDLLGSLRCDCGDQLRGAIRAIAAAGSGVLLYLAQEGRGIGLVNKLRAYSLQDLGADTFEANEQLGFDADERVFLPAAEMLRQLGFRTVRLLTNNPDKIEGLERSGLTVTERVAHSFPSNGHNAFYLAAKAVRGHLF